MANRESEKAEHGKIQGGQYCFKAPLGRSALHGRGKRGELHRGIKMEQSNSGHEEIPSAEGKETWEKWIPTTKEILIVGSLKDRRKKDDIAY